MTTKDVNDILIEENYYEYDDNNNITLENAKVYTYDVLNRIKTNDGTEYTYDLAGNILTKSILEAGTIKATTYVYNDKNQLLSTATLENTTLISESAYTYDDNGNQLTETTNNVTTTNTYNARNELTNVDDGQTVSQYSYNAEGKRVQKTVDNVTTKFVYDGDNIILELDNTNNQVATNTYGLALLKRTTNEEGYYLYNGHGDVTKILDNTNTVLNTYVYDSFGKILSETGTFNNPFKYAGYYYDNETKTYYLQARYYNPEIQRFISEDTYRGELEDPLSLNLYTYVKNNPLIYIDLTGHNTTAVLSQGLDIVKYLEPVIANGKEIITTGAAVIVIGATAITAGAVAIVTSPVTVAVVAGTVGGLYVGSQVYNGINSLKHSYDTPFVLQNSAIRAISFAEAKQIADNISQLEKDDSARIYCVYKLIDENMIINQEEGMTEYDRTKYIGMTKNLEARKYQHKVDPKKAGLSEPYVLISGLTKQEARIAEQIYISAGGLAKNQGQLRNEINSIAENKDLMKDLYRLTDFVLGTNTEAGKLSNRLEDQMLVELGI